MILKFYDLFGGIGGFRLGLQRASDDFECVGYADNDRFAVESYNEIFGENHEPRDVREIHPEELPDFDILCGGFPCQSFSIAGDRKGLEDTRGSLFFEIARIAETKEPEVIFLENVKGLLSAKAVTEEGEPIEGTKGYVFSKILETLHELGYFVEWQVLNSKHFGVPQNRERVFIIGHLGGEPRRKVFPLKGKDEKDTGEDGGEGNLTDKGYDTDMSKPQIGEAERVYGTDGVSPPLKSDEKLIHPSVTGAIGRAGSSSEYSYALSSSPHYVKPVMTPDFTDKNMNKPQSNGVKQDTRIRKLTPKECWRLQGFRDWAFEKTREVNSDTQLYKQAGNAVTVNVIEAIGKKIHEIKIQDNGAD